ncbi:MAG: hypothetical protein AAGH76_12435 [Pseudomonadota bacterium]
MASFKALNDTLYPAALAGLLVVAFTASHTSAPAASALNGTTPFGADGIEYVIQNASATDGSVIDLRTIAADESATSVSPVRFDVVVDEIAEHAGEHAMRVLLTTSEAATTL